MSNELHQLLKVHEFLDNALRQHGGRMASADISRLESRRDRAFLDILTYVSDEPRVTLAQVEFLLTIAVANAADADKADALQDACRNHLGRLAKQLKQPSNKAARPVRDDQRYLDSLGDHIAVFDAEYRYVYTNAANARFNGLRQEELIGRPNWTILGESFFERVNKPFYDACFRGEQFSYLSRHPTGDPSKLFSVSIRPVADSSGNICKVMVASRDISDLPIPAELILQHG